MVWGWWFAFTEFMISVIGMRSFYDGDDLKMGIIPITIHYPIVWNFCIAHRRNTTVQNCVWQYCVKCKKIVQLKYVMGYRNFEIFVFEMRFGGIFYFAKWPQHFNPYPPSDAYMCQWIRSVLGHIMAYRLFGIKPLSKPMLGYCELEP